MVKLIPGKVYADTPSWKRFLNHENLLFQPTFFRFVKKDVSSENEKSKSTYFEKVKGEGYYPDRITGLYEFSVDDENWFLISDEECEKFQIK
jgi:hypothetical protein